ncbi:carboxymuconolactone decarboxylase family protein [Conexibacter arvalis]|uniref:Alkyl hydroperoxide reductase AhpD n=1 Tax=Conexibacter arvalis TaxID=912552 RepID=A0A840IJG8_9ACTN|nr:carboxymuconolactone decarboxylase family protein [Conexibacter arvalis]MBB4664381.1 alkyl hydroperoxide reductase subunit D [Conexibacter arvalis]
MALETLRGSLPAYAKDLKLNIGSVTSSSTLSEQQLWGTVLASAAATRSQRTLAELAEEAREHLSEEAFDAALGAASIMGMNNVFYRAKHLLHGAYDDLRASLRMQIIGKPGVDRVDFELWSLAVSSINGCGACLESHEQVVREAGLTREQVFDALRVAAVVAGVAQAVEIDATLGAASLA